MALTRFAPSPTGYLHLGHAASACHVWRAAEALSAPVKLRVEDIDHTRCRPEYEDAILADLTRLGFEWDGPFRRQSDHLDNYADALSFLQQAGLIYRCFQTRQGIELARANSPDPAAPYTGEPLSTRAEQAHLDAGDRYAWRLSLRNAREYLGDAYETLCFTEISPDGPTVQPAQPERHGDVILARKDINTSYHIACCHDDALQAITHVVRGEDLRDVTHIHVLLQALMGWPQPLYQFHPLMLGPDGQKLSKRNQDKSLHTFWLEGVTPAQIRRMTGFE